MRIRNVIILYVIISYFVLLLIKARLMNNIVNNRDARPLCWGHNLTWLLYYFMTYTGCEKLNISTEDCQLVLEEDGTEIDEDMDIKAVAGRTFILLAKGQRWTEASSVGATKSSGKILSMYYLFII